MRHLIFFAGLCVFTSRALADATSLEHLAACLAGTFSTADQAHGDKNFRAVALHVIPLWTTRPDGPWLYSEQALIEVPDHPYRQRIYQLVTRPDGALEIRLFDLPDPIAVTGAWKDPALLADLSPANLAAQHGCNLVLRVQPDGSYKGGTEGKACLNTLRGATYATTDISIHERQTEIWERGFNASDIQVWGSTRGGFIFRKQ